MRTKKAFYIMISNLSYQLVYTLIWLVLPRLFMTFYGSIMNGLILSIRQFLNFFNIVEAGIGLSSVTALLKPLASNDKDAANGILSSTKIFYMRAGYIFLSLITLLAFIYPFLIAHQVDFKISFFLVLILGSSNFLDFFIIGKYKVLLTADQRGYVLTNIQIISLLINLISYVVLIKFGFNILLVNGIATLMFASRTFMVFVYVKKNYPYVSFKEQPNMAVLAQRKDVFIQQIAGFIVFNTPVIIITIFLGLKEVSVFTTYNMVFSAILLLLTSFSSALFAGLGDLLVRGEKQRVIEVFTIFESIFYAIIAWVFTTTFLLIIPFIRIYTHDVLDANYIRPDLAIFFIVAAVVTNIRIPAYTLVNSAGHFKETRNGAIAEAIINLVASLIFIQKFGTVGVLIGAFCSSIYRTVDLIFYASRKILNCSLKPTIFKLGVNLALSVVAVIPVQWLIKINPKNAYDWVVYAVILSIWNLMVIMTGNIIVDPKMSRNVFHRCKVVLSRKRGVTSEEM
ncbi:lipopolysaccharide biosynthesis protein [Neobacillus sp. NRS-1170]|uniref:lipopolysaccharide biosynthesis protein n=1 Tax=Neobacillus sp. NRS-1170 TaxID=3233898 RepID=UPI003D2B655B